MNTVLQERVRLEDCPPQADIPHAVPALGQDVRPRVLIIDDHPLFCAGLRALLQHEQGYDVVGEAGTGARALALARLSQPDLILLDIGLADTSGLDLANQLYRICPGTKIVVLTGCAEHEHVITAMRLGVSAFLQKEMPGPAILEAMQEVLRGEHVIGQPKTLSAVLQEFGHLLREREQVQWGLTEPEVEILRLAAAGLNNKEIGVHQFWSEITIKRKMQDIYRKMEVTSRAQAVAEAIRTGII